MSTLAHPTSTPTPQLVTAHGFSVGLDGRATGDDGRQGRLAAAVHYAARMAAQLDSALDLGPLRHLHVAGPSEIDVRVGWGIGGECLVDGVVRSAAPSARSTLPPVAPTGTPVPARGGHISEAIWIAAQQGTRNAARLDEAVRRVHHRTGATWTVLLDADLIALRLLGELAPGELAVLSSRTQGVVLGLGEPKLDTLTLIYAAGTVVLAQLEEATLMFKVDVDSLAQVAAVVQVARTALAEPVVLPEPAPAAEPVLEDATEQLGEAFEDDQGVDAWNDDRVQVPAGARFAGMVREPKVPGQPRGPRWLRR